MLPEQFQEKTENIIKPYGIAVRQSLSGSVYIKLPRASLYCYERHSIVINPNHGTLTYQSVSGYPLAFIRYDLTTEVVTEVCIENLYLDHRVTETVESAFHAIQTMNLEDSIYAFCRALAMARENPLPTAPPAKIYTIARHRR